MESTACKVVLFLWINYFLEKPMDFRYGIEHEVAFINQFGVFADYRNTPFSDFAEIIDKLPKYDNDYTMLRIGDAGIKLKRWYIEGFERFDSYGQMISCAPKGIEIRTTIHTQINYAICELTASFRALRKQASLLGYKPALISYNPHQSVFIPEPPLSVFEKRRRNGSPEKLTANIPMMTFGPDLSLSCKQFSDNDTINAARKLTYYSPYIIPFSFSSPFYKDELWSGFSYRTYQRTGQRPAAMAFIMQDDKLFKSSPSLTQKARVPAEVGRIEFKAFDSCGDFSLYAALLSLLKGIILDDSLPSSRIIPDKTLHQRSALYGFHDQHIKEQAHKVLSAAYQALSSTEDKQHLDRLFSLLEQEQMPAKVMKAAYEQGKSIEEVMLAQYAR
jgi:hypothetical protein